MEILNLLHQHIIKYPLLQIQDVAKLLYQNEFGGGHMIPNPDISLQRIVNEYVTLNDDVKNSEQAIESIGNGKSRIYLSALSRGLTPEGLNLMFVSSANNTTGTIEQLENKIDSFIEACRNKQFSFSLTEVIEFFKKWKSEGYPTISHSDIYRTTYQPAYRVIEDFYAHSFQLIQRIYEEQPKIVGIDGMSCSGKSTLATLLGVNFPDSNIIHMDDYFLRPEQRTSQRLAEIGGNIDYERFYDEIVSHIQDKNGLEYQPFDCSTQRLKDSIRLDWKPLLIIEGSYSLHPKWSDVYDMKIFLEVSPELQKERVLKRNGPLMYDRFVNEWFPKENAYFELYNIKKGTV